MSFAQNFKILMKFPSTLTGQLYIAVKGCCPGASRYILRDPRKELSTVLAVASSIGIRCLILRSEAMQGMASLGQCF